jgi:hypothetical protein
MALKDAINLNKARPCRFSDCLSHYSDEDIETLNDWITAQLPVRTMANAIKLEYPDHAMADATIAGHLRGQCSCPTEARFKGAWNE